MHNSAEARHEELLWNPICGNPAHLDDDPIGAEQQQNCVTDHGDIGHGTGFFCAPKLTTPCNNRVVAHGSVHGVACCCPNCGEPFRVWPNHVHHCEKCGNDEV